MYPPLSDKIPDKLSPPQQIDQTSDSEMYASITCVPPIGQPTIVPREQDSVSIDSVKILVLLLNTIGPFLRAA